MLLFHAEEILRLCVLRLIFINHLDYFLLSAKQLPKLFISCVFI